MDNILWNAAARLPRTALLFVAYVLVCSSSVVEQVPDVTESQKAQPAYNRDRGPVLVPGFRLHIEL